MFRIDGSAQQGMSAIKLSSLAVILALAVAACTATTTPSASQIGQPSPEGSATPGAPIKVGVIEPFTGFAAQLGDLALKGAQLALTEHGGAVQGHPIELLEEDDGCIPENAVNAANQLVSEQVVAVIGPECSAATATAGEIFSDAKIPYLFGAFLPELTERGDPFAFRAHQSDRFMLRIMVQMLEDEGLADSVGLARDSSGYGSGAGQAFIEELQAAGFPAPVVDVVFDLSATDYTGQIQAVNTASPGVLVVLTFEQQAGLFVKQMRQIGVETVVFTGVGGTDAFAEAAGDAVEGVRYDARYSSDDPETIAFTEAFRDEYGVNPDDSAISGYMAMTALLDALERAGPTAAGEVLRDAIRATNLDTGVGNISFDENGDLQHPSALIGIYQDGNRTIVDRVVD